MDTTMKIKFPLKVNIFGEEWELVEKRTEAYMGMTEYGTKKIYIKKGLGKLDQKQTIIHEVCHALFLRVSIYQAGVSSEVEEIIVDTLSKMLTEIFTIEFKE